MSEWSGLRLEFLKLNVISSGLLLNIWSEQVRKFIYKSQKLTNFQFFIITYLGMIAVRENRYVVLAKDFEKAYKNQLKNKDEMEHEFYH